MIGKTMSKEMRMQMKLELDVESMNLLLQCTNASCYLIAWRSNFGVVL